MKARSIALLVSAAALGAVHSAAGSVPAPVLTTIVSFTGVNGGAPEASLVADSVGNLYGTTDYGNGNNGTVFDLSADRSILKTLATFNGSNGGGPVSGISFDSAGNIFGTTYLGGPNGCGGVYEVLPNSGKASLIAPAVPATGSYFGSTLVADASGNFYGTASEGGPNGDGAIYKIAAGSHAYSTVANFNGSNGAGPMSDLTIDSAGNLYGVTSNSVNNAQSSSEGDVYEIKAGTNAITPLAFFNTASGSSAQCKLVRDSAGDLFGTAFAGGAGNDGTVFELPAGGSSIVPLASFNGSDGQHPYDGVIVDAAGDLFGTTFNGGSGSYGTVFEIAAGTGTIQDLASFNSSDGYLYAGLYADPAGNLYGETSIGGSGGNGQGTIFEITNSGFVTAVPEPSALAVIGAGGATLLRRRRVTTLI